MSSGISETVTIEKTLDQLLDQVLQVLATYGNAISEPHLAMLKQTWNCAPLDVQCSLLRCWADKRFNTAGVAHLMSDLGIRETLKQEVDSSIKALKEVGFRIAKDKAVDNLYYWELVKDGKVVEDSRDPAREGISWFEEKEACLANILRALRLCEVTL